MLDRYPILVEKFGIRANSLKLGCDACGYSWMPKDVDEHLAAVDYGFCPRCGSGEIFPAYDTAPKCGGCGKLGYHEKQLNYCCSRTCMLQVEYAESLKKRGGG